MTIAKWKKGKDYIKSLKEELITKPKTKIDYKRLERIRGYLCHLAMVYEILFPFLKEFHLTLASHLQNRSDEGWKLSDQEWIQYIKSKVEEGRLLCKEADDLL